MMVRTLSPIHIGSGEKADGVSFLVSSDRMPFKVHLLNFDIITKAFNRAQMDKLVSWLENERSPNLFYFIKDIPGMDKKLKGGAIYSIPLYPIDLNDPRKRFPRDFDLFIKTLDYKPYIPGSEIKGAIRTAVLYSLVERDYGKLKGKISGIRSLEDFKKADDWLQNEFLRGVEKDPKYDILKFLSIADTDAKAPQESLFLCNFKIVGMRGEPNLYHEVCKGGVSPGESVCFKTTFSLNIEEKIKTNLFNGDQQDFLGKESILKCCYDFANESLDSEIGYFDQRLKPVADKLRAIKRLNEKNSPVLRLGKGEGFLNVTINLLVKKRDGELYKKIVDDSLKITKKRARDRENFPVTRRVAKITKPGGVDYLPLGWVKLIF
ncbi:MAG: type III-A CRISPR-associated RAMP protein Csm5 [bacterium]